MIMKDSVHEVLHDLHYFYDMLCHCKNQNHNQLPPLEVKLRGGCKCISVRTKVAGSFYVRSMSCCCGGKIIVTYVIVW